MIYDKPISLLSMPDTTGIPSPGCLVPVFDAWCAEKTVYAKRFWEAVANGSRVDKLVELPLHRDVPAASYGLPDSFRSNNLDYSASGTAKLTVLCDVDTGEKDDDGEPIVSRQRSTWYLAEDGTVSQTVPARRASGTWDTISVKKLEEVETKVIETFAKNKTNHKLEFWSTLNLNVQDNCTFYAYGEILRSYISYKRKSSEDSRYYYKSGELATTATEKLRGVIK